VFPVCGYVTRTLWGQVTIMLGTLPNASVTFRASIVSLYPIGTVLSSVLISASPMCISVYYIVTHWGFMDKNFNPLTCDGKCGRMRAKMTRTKRFLWGLSVSFSGGLKQVS